MEEKYGLQRQHSGIWRSLRDGDFEEEEVWAVLKEKPEYNSSGVFKPKESFSSSSSSSLPLSVPRPLPSASRMIPKASSSSSIHNNSYSSMEAKVLQQSAPVNIPDWSKIYGNNTKQKKAPHKRNSRLGNFHDDDDDDDDDNEGVVNYGGDTDDEEEEEEEEEEDDEYDPKLPPHEFIARRLARSQISSFSVFEGVGRKLKGRDLSKVRNAVLSKTGFLESL